MHPNDRKPTDPKTKATPDSAVSDANPSPTVPLENDATPQRSDAERQLDDAVEPQDRKEKP